MTAAAGLLLWALLLAADVDSHCSLVLIYEDAPVERLEARCSEVANYQDGILGGWIWSRLRPPVRFTGAEVFEWPTTADSADRLRVTLVDGAKRGQRTPRLLSAPVEMWAEVPEGLLPAWTIGAGTSTKIPTERDRLWRLRLLDSERGTWWMDLEAATGIVRVGGVPAEHIEIEVVDQAGAPVEGATLRVLDPAVGFADARIQAVYQSDAQGRIVIVSVPADRLAAFLLTGSGSTPRLLEGQLSSLPRRIALKPGAELSGRFLAYDGTPVGEVGVHVRSWLPGDTGMTYGQDTTSDETGRWSLVGALPGEAVLLAQKRGIGRLNRIIQVGPLTTDLGDLVLQPGATLEIRAVDDTESVVPGARIVTDTGTEVYTDAHGRAVLQELEPGRSLMVSASADGHLRSERHVAVEPGTSQTELVLRRAHAVVGRLVDDQGMPVAAGSLRTITGASSSHSTAGAGGWFEVWLEPRRPTTLALSSERSVEIQVSVAAGEPGEITDLGDIALPPGTTVKGRVLDGSTGLPVAGARIWAPRVDAEGPIVAWVRGDLLEADTDPEGLFRLMGLGNQPSLLRIEASGYARRHITLSWIEGPEDEVDLGEIYLSAGVSLVVQVDPPPESVADLRVDLRNEWLEPDVLRAPVIAGKARVDHVPPGPATLTVVSGRELLCVREIELPDGVDTFEAECETDHYTVEGVVLRGGRPLGPGRLIWMAPGPEVVASIVTRTDLGGLRQSRAYGAGRPAVESPVAADGTFRSTSLSPGDWQVVWSGEARAPGGTPIEVHLRDEPRQEVTLVVPGGLVRGRVTDTEGNGVASARVMLSPGGAVTFSDAGGAFEIGGVAYGPTFLRARLGERMSELVEIQLLDGVEPDPILLVLGDDSDPEARVRVLEENGEPAVGALLFLQDDRGRSLVLTTDQTGTAKKLPQTPPAGRYRVAALHRGRWTLGEWTSARDLELVLDDGDTAGLRIWTDQDHEGPVRILGPGAWELSWILARAGLRPVLRPGVDLEVTGVPPGTYSVSLGAASATIILSAGEIADLRLD